MTALRPNIRPRRFAGGGNPDIPPFDPSQPFEELPDAPWVRKDELPDAPWIKTGAQRNPPPPGFVIDPSPANKRDRNAPPAGFQIDNGPNDWVPAFDPSKPYQRVESPRDWGAQPIEGGDHPLSWGARPIKDSG